MKKLVTLLFAAAMVPLSHGQITNLFSHSSDLAGIDNRFENDGSTFIVASVDGSGTIGSGDALRIADLSTVDKPEAVWSKTPAINTAFRLDLNAYNASVPVDYPSADINLRFADSSHTITSSQNVMATISFEADAKLKVNGATVFTFAANTPAAISLVFNVSTTDSLNYTLFNANRTLDAQSVSTFVDGVLLDTRVMTYGASFDPVSGVAKIGFTGSSDADKEPDYQFDNFILYEGDDISTALSPVPEPAAFAAILGVFALGMGCGRRRRRVA